MLSNSYEVDYLEQTGAVMTGPLGNVVEEAFALAKLSSTQREAIQRAKKYAMEQSIKTVMVKQTLAYRQQQQVTLQQNMQMTQALALMCRVYVGNINFDVNEQTIRQAFLPFGPMRSVSMPYDPLLHKHKGFAFVEYEVPEAASLALDHMNNVLLGGRSVKVGRPSNMPAALNTIADIIHEAQHYHRIYIASVHADLNDNDIRSVFEAFGPIKSCYLVKEPSKPSRHRGYGFIEYETPKAAEDAIAAMNMFDLGGQYLRVGRCVTPPTAILTLGSTPNTNLPTEAAVALAAVTARITAADVTGASAAPGSRKFSSVPPPTAAAQVPNPGPPGVVQLAPTTPVQPAAALPPIVDTCSAAAYGKAPVIAPPGVVTPMLGQPPYSAVPPMPLYGMPPMPSAIPLVPPPPGFAAQSLYSSAAVSASLIPPPPAVPAPPPIALNDGATLDDHEDPKIKGHQSRHLVMQRLMRKVECKVMVLRNMVGAEDVDELLETEVSEECSHYGTVVKVIIYQEKQGEEEDAETVVKIFVEFSAEQEVERAIASLNGRYFGGRIVQAEKYDMDFYQNQDFSA